VFTGSPAEDAGVRAGDRLVSIDGRMTRRLGLESTRRLLRVENCRYRLRLEREGQLVTTQLVTTDLLKTKAATL
jgi:predicted metalloprotease with PDZ domain